MIIGEMAKKSEAKSPAVVPPIVLTSAKITIVVSEPNNSDELLNKILDLLPKKEKRLRMANEGLEIVKKYDWKRVGNLYLNFYESLLN